MYGQPALARTHLVPAPWSCVVRCLLARGVLALWSSPRDYWTVQANVLWLITRWYTSRVVRCHHPTLWITGKALSFNTLKIGRALLAECTRLLQYACYCSSSFVGLNPVGSEALQKKSFTKKGRVYNMGNEDPQNTNPQRRATSSENIRSWNKKKTHDGFSSIWGGSSRLEFCSFFI